MIILKEILPVILNTSFERLAVIDDYISLIWTTRYYTTGDFELCTDVNKKYMSLFMKGYYVVREDDEHVGIIEDVKIQRQQDGHEILIVSGRFLASILGRRIIADQTTVTGKISSCINTLITNNVINPEIEARQIENFVLGTYDIATTMQAQYTGKNLLETISAICEAYGIGFKVILNENNEFEFSLFTGTDRTYDQSVNPWVVFSDANDNLLSSEYEENYKNIATAVLVAGEGEGDERKKQWVTDGSTGLARYELWKDQRNIQSNDGEISEDEYNKLLQESGKESLTVYTTAFSGTVYFDNIQYKTDVNIGDLCVIENSRWGLYINSRLVEVIESVSESGEYSIVPTFGV